MIGVVPVGVTTGAGAVGATTTGAGAVGAGATTTGAVGAVAVGATTTGAVGATTTGAVGATETIVVTTGAGVVETLGDIATGVADTVELLDPPPPEIIGVEISTGTGVLVGVILVVVFTFRNIFIASILFLRSENTVALTRVIGATVVALTLRIACTNERDFLFTFADRTIVLASVTFCLWLSLFAILVVLLTDMDQGRRVGDNVLSVRASAVPVQRSVFVVTKPRTMDVRTR